MSDSDVSSPLKENQRKKIKVFFQPKPTINVCLKFAYDEVCNLPLRDFIVKCARMLKQDYLLEVHQFVKGYQLFVADKAGKKKSGLPELDLDYIVEKTKVHRFFLEDLSKTHSLISKEFNLQKKYGFQKKVKQNSFCCHLFKLVRS